MVNNKKPVRVSYSALEKYRNCSEQYRLHYIERIRDTKNPSSLIFGSALDEALNILLLQKKKNLTEEEKAQILLDPIDVFNEKLNKPNMEYFKSDLDIELLGDHDIEGMTNDEMSFLSLVVKGKLFLEAYQKVIMPRIYEVISIQSNKELKNAEGDILITKTDFVADWETAGNTILFDNKTSVRKYSENSVIDSSQLAIYGEAEELTRCGYIVCIKAIKKDKKQTCNVCSEEYSHLHKSCKTKKCTGKLILKITPAPEIQVVISDIPESTKELVFDDIQRHTQYIKDGRFEKNTDSCYQYGKPCVYKKYCFENKNMKGLIRLDEK